MQGRLIPLASSVLSDLCLVPSSVFFSTPSTSKSSPFPKLLSIIFVHRKKKQKNKKNSKKNENPMSCCQCLLVCHLLGDNTIYHSFHNSSNSPKSSLNTFSDVLGSLALVPPETTQRLLDSVTIPLWQGYSWKKTESIILWATLTRPQKYESKSTNALPVTCLRGWLSLYSAVSNGQPSILRCRIKDPLWTEMDWASFVLPWP